MQRIESTGFGAPFFFASAGFSAFAAEAPSPGRSGRTDAGARFGSGACAFCGAAAAASDAKSSPAGAATGAAALDEAGVDATGADDGAAEAGGADDAAGAGGT